MKELFEGKVVLVTGGLGSIGEAIVERILEHNPKQIRIFDNRETELFYARSKYPLDTFPMMRFLYGDIRDKDRVMRATEGVNIIFHAAAMKHVILCENDPFEAVKTNVFGTQTLIECAVQNDVDKFILISTDKAVNPFNVMGATKLLAERLVSATYCNKGTSKTKFGTVRFGNVLSSRGSVLEIWRKQLGDGEKITITDPEMTRFFMTIPESVDLIFEATSLAEWGETFIFKMNSVKIGDLGNVFLELNGASSDQIRVIGSKKGEKMHEDLIFDAESGLTLENKELFVRMPMMDDIDYDTNVRKFGSKGFTPFSMADFSSNNKNILLEKEQIKSMISDFV